MDVNNIPETYINNPKVNLDLFVYDFKMTKDIIKTKVSLTMHMFSFLQKGKKQVHFANTSVLVHNKQSLLVKKGNCLWSELLDVEDVYYCKLFFFSDKKLKEFTNKYIKTKSKPKKNSSYFVIESDSYLTSYLTSLSEITAASHIFIHNLLSVKFEELLMYLLNKYGSIFEDYLLSLIAEEESSFKKSVEKNIYSKLTLEEIAFLCNMSLSTFKRHFVKTYGISPGKWFRDKRLLKAKELLKQGNLKSSDIYLDLGYNNLSNFSIAFKNKFGVSPTELK